MKDPIIIAVDFDGTIVEHAFPNIGAPIDGAFAWLRRFQEAGAKLILFTMRSDHRGPAGVASPEGHAPTRDFLKEAVEFCAGHGLRFWGINHNPEQRTWTASPKPYAHMYIDDAAVGCPWIADGDPNRRRRADWTVIGPNVMARIRGMR